jgi:hypothetical protein
MVRRILAASSVLVLMAASVALGAPTDPGGTFLDDDGNVHEGAIEAIALEGITLGCNPPDNDLYCPEDPVTRGQMAAFLVRAYDLPPTGGDPFVDDDGSVFEADIEALAAAGITLGCNPPDNDEFCPDDHVTREQMAGFLDRAGDYPPSSEDAFVDDGASIFEPQIDAIAAAGVTTGCNPPDNDEYCPTALVQRDQMASFLARALGLEQIVPPPRDTSSTTSTTSSSTSSTTYGSSSSTSTSSTGSTSSTSTSSSTSSTIDD